MNSENLKIINPNTPKIKSSELTIWDLHLLFAICIGPAFAGLSLLVVIVSSSALIIKLLLKSQMLKPSPQALLVFFIFLIYFLYFYLNGAWLDRNILAPSESMKGNLPILIIAAWCLCLSSHLSNMNSAKVGRWATIAILAIMSVALLAYISQIYFTNVRSELINQMWHGGVGGRLKYFSKNALMFGSMFTALSFMALIGFNEKTYFEKATSLTAVFAGLTTVGFWAESRGAMLVSLPLLALSIWYIRPKFNISFLLSLLITMSMLGLLATNKQIALITEKPIERIMNGLKTATDPSQGKDLSVNQRITMYTLGIEAVKNSPIFGHGYQNRFDAILPFMEKDQEFRHGHLHNAFLNHWVAGGVVGLLIFLTFLFSPLALLIFFGKKSRDSKFFAWIIMLTLAGVGMTTEVLGHFVHSNFYGLLICALALVTANEKLPNESAYSDLNLKSHNTF